MNGDDHIERRAIVQVADRPIELQSMLQTVLTFLLLGVMSWIGITLEKVKDNTAENNKAIAVFSVHLENQRQRMHDHINNPRAHK